MINLDLIEAVKEENLERINELIDVGTDINQQDEQGWTPLNFAAGKGNAVIVKMLIDKGANILKVGRDQRTPLLIALAAGHLEAATILRDREAASSADRSSRPLRQYCKAFYIKQFKNYPEWSNNLRSSDGKDATLAEFIGDDDNIVFIHQDYTVTKSMWHGEDVIIDKVNTSWISFCTDKLQFKAPDDFDLVSSASQRI